MKGGPAMKNILLIPDSFKGTLSARQVCETMTRAIKNRLSGATVRSIPAADGGEGTVDAFLTALGGEKVICKVCGPNFAPIDSFYGLLPDGTAVIEMAACAGLPLVGAKKNPERTTTYGVGQLVSGWLGDRVSPKWLLVFGLLLTSCMNLTMPAVSAGADGETGAGAGVGAAGGGGTDAPLWKIRRGSELMRKLTRVTRSIQFAKDSVEPTS